MDSLISDRPTLPCPLPSVTRLRTFGQPKSRTWRGSKRWTDASSVSSWRGAPDVAEWVARERTDTYRGRSEWCKT